MIAERSKNKCVQEIIRRLVLPSRAHSLCSRKIFNKWKKGERIVRFRETKVTITGFDSTPSSCTCNPPTSMIAGVSGLMPFIEMCELTRIIEIFLCSSLTSGASGLTYFLNISVCTLENELNTHFA